MFKRRRDGCPIEETSVGSSTFEPGSCLKLAGGGLRRLDLLQFETVLLDNWIG